MQQAMKEEENKWLGYEAYEVVPDNGQEYLTMRWVINQKEQADGQKTEYKARMCVRGFQENIVPRSDSPTAAKNMLKASLAVAANEGWRLENLDVTSAFLQGADLEREIYVLPPKEIQQEGQLGGRSN